VNLITVVETAVLLHVSVSWVRRHLSELPVVPMPGHVVRIDSEQIQAMIAHRKSLEPREPLMVNRYQRGSIAVRGKTKMYYGSFRIDTSEGKRLVVNVPLGLVKDLNLGAARKALAKVIAERTKTGAVPAPPPVKFSELVEKWKLSECQSLGDSTRAHYSNALRSLVPSAFQGRVIGSIQRDDITALINQQAERYSKSSLRSLRLVLKMTLAWAEKTALIVRPTGWLDGIRLPKKNGGRTVTRTELKPEQTRAIVERLPEPYATLVLCLASVGCRGEEAVGLQPADLDAANVLWIRRVIYNGKVEALDKPQQLPLNSVVHADLIRRMRALGAGQKWIFHSRSGTPVNMGNARRRYLHPATQAVGVRVGGWHDFRHTLVRTMRRGNVNPVVISGAVGHKSVELAAEVYDSATTGEIGLALRYVGEQLQHTMQHSGSLPS
jgi:integrase